MFWSLTFTTLGEIFNRRHTKIFFVFFPETGSNISCKLSPQFAWNVKSSFFLGKIRKNISVCRMLKKFTQSAERYLRFAPKCIFAPIKLYSVTSSHCLYLLLISFVTVKLLLLPQQPTLFFTCRTLWSNSADYKLIFFLFFFRKQKKKLFFSRAHCLLRIC